MYMLKSISFALAPFLNPSVTFPYTCICCVFAVYPFGKWL